MAEAPDVVGGLDDRVSLRLGGDELLIAEAWDVNEGVLATPASWSITFGRSQPIAKLFTVDPAIDGTGTNALGGQGGPTYPKGTKVEVFIGPALQMTGRLEGVHVSGKESRCTIKGRDALAPLMMAHSEAQRSFIDGTYTELVTWALKEAGIDSPRLQSSNLANRKVKAGVTIDEIEGVETIDEINQVGTSGAAGPNTTGTLVGAIVHQQHQNNITESLLHFVRRHLDRAGLFLWAAADGSFVLSQPNGNQEPIYRVVRKRGTQESSNVIDVDFTDDWTHSHSSAVVYGRGGGRKSGRGKALGASGDSDMFAHGFKQPILFRDVNVQTTEQAEFFARRKLAEERRNAWNLTYTIRGHRLQPIDGGAALGPVVTPDTCVHVEDDELGLNGKYYVESVRRLRSPQTTTQVRLMRIEDLIFGTGGID